MSQLSCSGPVDDIFGTHTIANVRILSEEGALLGRFVIDPAKKYQAKLRD